MTALTGLYVPGDRPERFDTAAASGADIVVLDLEDSIAPAAKERARDAVREWLTVPRSISVQVRVNAGHTSWAVDDLAMLRGLPGRVAVRLPKVESPSDIDAALAAAGADLAVHAIVESAAGVEAAAVIAAHRCVRSIGLGEADLSADLGTSGEDALGWVRSRLVVAARAAGLPAPMMSVYPDVADLAGLARSCTVGRSLGFCGRSAIHPRQLPVIVTAFRPSAAEVARARSVIDALAAATTNGRGVTVLPSGAMLDAAMLPAAQRTLALDAAADAADRAFGPPGQR